MACMGLINGARVNFGTESPKIPYPCQVTLSDVTTLPEVSISVYGAGPPVRDTQDIRLLFCDPS